MLPHRGDALDVLSQPFAANLHLDGTKAFGEVGIGLFEQGVDREIKIDASRVAGNPRVVAAEELPERQTGSPRLEIPQRDVDRRQCEHDRPTPTTIVQRPPDSVPHGLDEIRVETGDDSSDLAGQDIMDRAAISAYRVGITDALRTVPVTYLDRAQLEIPDYTVRTVGEGDRKRHPVQFAF